MKTNFSSKIVKISVLTPLAVTIGVLLLQPATAAPITHDLVLTENSSTSLTATYDGSTSGVSVIFISGDHWGVTVGFPVTFSENPQWTEPDDPSAFNVITLAGIANQFIVNSDFFSNGTTPLADGATFTGFGTDARDGASISVTFNDRGDVATVPETGSTISLLCLALTALVGANYFRGHRLA
jgi:hypothetical protein